MGSEFDLISRFFKRPVPAGMLGGGDDCALFQVTPGLALATSKDLLLEGRHFFSDVDPYSLGHKALAVNLSDLAAMGAKPLACLLGLALPTFDEKWLAAFADGFYSLAEQHGCALIGGDTTRSQHGVVISVTVLGEVDPARAMRRHAAQVGDDIWVSGRLGAADVAYRILDGQLSDAPYAQSASRLSLVRAALEKPTPRVQLGCRLSAYAHAAIDLSDGLLQDLGHILQASGVGASIQEILLPVDAHLVGLPEQVLRRAVLAGGDVYELCLTASRDQRDHFERIAREEGIELTRIGQITAEKTLHVHDEAGRLIHPLPQGFDHFRD